MLKTANLYVWARMAEDSDENECTSHILDGQPLNLKSGKNHF